MVNKSVVFQVNHKTNYPKLTCLFNNIVKIFENMVNWCIIKQINGTFKYNNFKIL